MGTLSIKKDQRSILIHVDMEVLFLNVNKIFDRKAIDQFSQAGIQVELNILKRKTFLYINVIVELMVKSGRKFIPTAGVNLPDTQPLRKLNPCINIYTFTNQHCQ